MNRDLRKELGLNLRQHLKKQRYHQVELAQKLKLTPSAVSQILSGKIVPTQEIFDRVVEFLALPCEETERLQALLLGIRAGMHRMQSPLNRRIFSLRCQAGLSFDEIRAQCGISPQRMQKLENISSAVPSEAEREALEKLFGEELLPVDRFAAGSAPSERLEVAEDKTDDPLAPGRDDRPPKAYFIALSPETFADFRAGDSLADYIMDRGMDFVSAEYCPEWKNAVVVQGDCASFHLKSAGAIRLILADPPEGAAPRLFFCGDGQGNFFLLGDGAEAGMAFELDRELTAAWRLPVAEIRWRPAWKSTQKEVTE